MIATYLLGLYQYDVLDDTDDFMLFPIHIFQSTDTMKATHICCY